MEFVIISENVLSEPLLLLQNLNEYLGRPLTSLDKKGVSLTEPQAVGLLLEEAFGVGQGKSEFVVAIAQSTRLGYTTLRAETELDLYYDADSQLLLGIGTRRQWKGYL